MNLFATIFALSQALGFKLQDLSDRRLQEHGVSALNTFTLQRYAFIPAILWCFLFIKITDISYLIHTPLILGYLFFIAFIWNIQAFLASYIMNTVSSMSALVTLQTLIYLPLLLFVGTFFNKDSPNIFSILAIICLLVAFIVQPSQHENNIRTRFSLPLAMIIGLALLRAILDAINTGITREILKLTNPEIYLGVFSLIATGICLIIFLFLPRSKSDKVIIKKHQWLALAIPILWFAASIPESWSYAELPIYTVVSIGAVTFILDTVSDIYHKRLRFNFRTAVFILLALGGMTLAVCSV